MPTTTATKLNLQSLLKLCQKEFGLEQKEAIAQLQDLMGVESESYRSARIDKFKVSRDTKKGRDKFQVEYAFMSVDGDWNERSMTSRDEPRAELFQALKALVPYCLVMLEVSKEWADDEDVTVTGASFTYADDPDNTMGVVLTLQKKYSDGDVQSFPTRLRYERPPGGGFDESRCFDKETGGKLERLIEEIRKFLAGDRAGGLQTQLSFIDD